jgi:hypothetical protein
MYFILQKVKKMEYQVPLGEVFLPVLRFSPVYRFPPMFHTHLHPHVTLARKTNGQNLEIVQKAVLSGNREELDRQEEGVRTYISKVVADLPSYTASHHECRDFMPPTVRTIHLINAPSSPRAWHVLGGSQDIENSCE